MPGLPHRGGGGAGWWFQGQPWRGELVITGGWGEGGSVEATSAHAGFLQALPF